ncbi:TPA_exp: Uncharacterized protein A8136_4858 [Trichophyton benhamiae CBS 112371]|uniref:Uncharacterized protein n=1 Tax=Arthroderma benhamiae (strain ATCC MYA-4681 / CBS 112371) TaxID=663331 RepID=D4B3H9_ARTBC|nr:uncharacterized protein ARB_03018 [Trichophyton benhamiae CBS 112371]EFE29677.1 hypothetical protein ARB_03018 [Trichophyton benhamiae CBS 112371]DAA72933.1 TPA_exp: Uncharacterized protein A8136_4858 [Trichophyton benhamiae CBS 112371]
MFSVVLPGRPCLTEAVPIQPDPNTPPTNFAFTFPAAPKFSHIVVFLLPGVTLPPDVAAAVYIQFPNLPGNGQPQQQQPEFRFLGAIANEKPSAIFKVNLPGSQKPMTEAEQENEMMDEGAAAVDPNAIITLGIAIESTQVVREKLATLQQPSTGMELVKRTGQPGMTTKVLAQRIIGNAFNFLASFAASDPRAQGEEVVPLKSFRDWWAKFERRIEADPGFLEREGS